MRPYDIRQHVTPKRRGLSTELHWVSSTDPAKAENVAPVTPKLGKQPWDTFQLHPLRISAGTSRGENSPAFYFWQPTGRHVWCESQTERDELMWLDYQNQVTQVWSQPLLIAFDDTYTAGRWHVPDFFAVDASGQFWLFDVKPEEDITPKAAAQFGATAEVCATLGWQYEVLTGHDPRATQNLSWLKSCRHERCRPPADALDRILTHARAGATRGELCRVAAPDCPARATVWVDYLTWHRLLDMSLMDVFSNDTELFTTGEGTK